jgi:hypothetical protein
MVEGRDAALVDELVGYLVEEVEKAIPDTSA